MHTAPAAGIHIADRVAEVAHGCVTLATRAPETPKIKLKCGPPAQISSDCLRKSLDFEIGVGYRLGDLRMSKSKR